MSGRFDGMEKLGPGIYDDGKGHLHLDAVELCQHWGVPATAENQAALEAAARQAFASVNPDGEFVTHDAGRRPVERHLEDGSVQYGSCWVKPEGGFDDFRDAHGAPWSLPPGAYFNVPVTPEEARAAIGWRARGADPSNN